MIKVIQIKSCSFSLVCIYHTPSPFLLNSSNINLYFVSIQLSPRLYILSQLSECEAVSTYPFISKSLRVHFTSFLQWLNQVPQEFWQMYTAYSIVKHFGKWVSIIFNYNCFCMEIKHTFQLNNFQIYM